MRWGGVTRASVSPPFLCGVELSCCFAPSAKSYKSAMNGALSATKSSPKITPMCVVSYGVARASVPRKKAELKNGGAFPPLSIFSKKSTLSTIGREGCALQQLQHQPEPAIILLVKGFQASLTNRLTKKKSNDDQKLGRGRFFGQLFVVVIYSAAKYGRIYATRHATCILFLWFKSVIRRHKTPETVAITTRPPWLSPATREQGHAVSQVTSTQACMQYVAATYQ